MLTISRPPNVALGCGRTTLADKFSAIMHSLFLLTGAARACEVFIGFVRGLATLTTDHGVEMNLAFVRPVPIRDILPWFRTGGGSNMIHRYDENEDRLRQT